MVSGLIFQIADDLRVFEDFLEFPSPHLLKERNVAFGELQPALKKGENDPNKILPLYKFKEEVFRPGDFKAVDKHALEV